MNTIGIIPARYASTRFPGKPLVMVNGRSMIHRVYQQALKAGALDHLVVATDDERIADHVEAFGGRVVMTASTHQSGTDRCAEVLESQTGFDVAINIQGDEPYINPEQINLVVSCFQNPETQIATLVKVIHSYEELLNSNTPKVLLNYKKEAIYFSRATLPFQRNAASNLWLDSHTYYKHIGIYGYKSKILQELTQLPVSALEKAESLEQLRWLENGYRIQTAETDLETLAIDEPHDLDKLKNLE